MVLWRGGAPLRSTISAEQSISNTLETEQSISNTLEQIALQEILLREEI
jgi:hypothetical protein